MKRLILILCLLCLSVAARAQPSQPLLSFAYGSNGVDSNGMLQFYVYANGGQTGPYWQMGLGTGMAIPGSGAFPTGNFYIRAISLSVFSSLPSDFAVIGHSGPNGDWVTPPVHAGQTKTIVFPDDAAPLFTAGEYFDAHSSGIVGSALNAKVVFWYTPVP